MADLDFLHLHPDGNAAITVLLPDGTVSRVDKLSATAIADKCPLLYHALDDGPHGDFQASIEADSLDLVISFCRFLYTGSYLTLAEENAGCSLLKHAQIYKMARDFDVPELEVSAHVSFMQETEMSCGVPAAPPGLCDAIRFVFLHLVDQRPLLDTLLNYCVHCFSYHGLGSDTEFRNVAFEIPEFHKALCQTSFRRDFKDDGAEDIVRLPVCQSNPRSIVLSDADLAVEHRSHAEFQFEEWYDAERAIYEADTGFHIKLPVLSPSSIASRQDSAQPSPCSPIEAPAINTPDTSPVAASSADTEGVHAEERGAKRRKTITEREYTVVHRPKNADEEAVLLSDEHSSDEEWVTVAHRSKNPMPLASGTSEAQIRSPSAPNANATSPTPDFVDVPLSPGPAALGDDEADSDWSLI